MILVRRRAWRFRPLGVGFVTWMTGCGATSASAPRDAGSSAVDGPTTTTEASSPVEAGALDGSADSGAATPVVLADDQNSPAYLALDATNVYWTNAGTAGGATSGPVVAACAKSGCAGGPSTLWSGPYGDVGELAVQGLDGPVYWADASSRQIVQCAGGGCGGSPAAVVGAVGVPSVAADAFDLAWATSDGSVFYCARGDCPGSQVLLVPGAASGGPSAVATDASNVYWTASDTGQVMKCSKSGCAGAPTVLASNQDHPSTLVVDSTNVYWIDFGSIGAGNVPAHPTTGLVQACALGGCNAPTTLVSYPSWFGGGAIAVDATHLYWTTALASADGGQVVRCAIAGCAGSPTVLASTQTGGRPSQGLAVDDGNLYWTDRGLGEVLRLAKSP